MDPSTFRKLGRNRSYMVDYPFLSSFQFGSVLYNFPIDPNYWHVAAIPGCGGHSMCPRSDIIYGHPFSAAKFSELCRSVLVFSADGSLIDMFEVLSDVEDTSVCGLFHLFSTGHLVVCCANGVVKVFTLNGAKLKQLKVFSDPRVQEAVVLCACTKNSLAFLLDDGTVTYFDDVSGYILSKKSPRLCTCDMTVLRQTLTAWPPTRDAVGALAILGAAEQDDGDPVIILTTRNDSPTVGSHLLLLNPRSGAQSVAVSFDSLLPAACAGFAGTQLEGLRIHPGQNLLLFAYCSTLTPALALLDISAYRRTRAGSPVPRVLAHPDLLPECSGDPFLFDFCDIFPAYYSGDALVVLAASGKAPTDCAEHRFPLAELFSLEHTAHGLLFRSRAPSERATGRITRVHDRLVDIYGLNVESKACLLMLAYRAYKNPSTLSDADTTIQSIGCGMEQAVRDVLAAAQSACDRECQAELLYCAAFGKLFLDQGAQRAVTEEYDAARRQLRILNDFSTYPLSYALTGDDFQRRYTYLMLISYLCCRGLFDKAMAYCTFLFPDSQASTDVYRGVLLQFALFLCLHARFAHRRDADILGLLERNIGQFRDVAGSYRQIIDILLQSDDCKRYGLLSDLVDREHSIADRVLLYTSMGLYAQAVRACVETSSTGLLLRSLVQHLRADGDVVLRQGKAAQTLTGSRHENVYFVCVAGDKDGGVSKVLLPDVCLPMLALVLRTMQAHALLKSLPATECAELCTPQLAQELTQATGDANLELQALLSGLSLNAYYRTMSVARASVLHGYSATAGVPGVSRPPPLLPYSEVRDAIAAMDARCDAESRFRVCVDYLRSVLECNKLIRTIDTTREGFATDKQKKGLLKARPGAADNVGEEFSAAIPTFTDSLSLCRSLRECGKYALTAAFKLAAQEKQLSVQGSVVLSDIKRVFALAMKKMGAPEELLYIAVGEGIIGGIADLSAEGLMASADEKYRGLSFFIDYYKTTVPKNALPRCSYIFGAYLVAHVPDFSKIALTLVTSLVANMSPREAVKFAVSLGDEKLFEKSCAELGASEMEFLQIAYSNLTPGMRAAFQRLRAVAK